MDDCASSSYHVIYHCVCLAYCKNDPWSNYNSLWLYAHRSNFSFMPYLCTYFPNGFLVTDIFCILIPHILYKWVVRGIQIKICAEYRDMLPRPRLVCQEPGLRPIGRSPGVPDKSSRGLGSMSRYSAQILICFIAYIFSISLWVWLGTLQNCHHAQCPLPLFIVIRMRLLSAHQTIKSPSMPCWGAAGRNTLWHSCHRTGEISR